MRLWFVCASYSSYADKLILHLQPVILWVVTEGVDGIVSTRPASFQHTLSDQKVSQILGACEANAARADTMIRHFGGVPDNVKFSVLRFIADVKISHFHHSWTLSFHWSNIYACCRCVFAMHGGWRWPSSLEVSRIIRPSLAFMKSAPSFDLAAEDATNLIMLHRV